MFKYLREKGSCKGFFIAFINLFVSLSLNAIDIVIDDTNTTTQTLSNGDNLYVTNDGNLSVDGTAILPLASDINIENNGTIYASSIAIFMDSLTGTITNEATGSITADTSAIFMNSNFGTIINNGTIDSKAPIYIGANDGNITNNGILRGEYYGIAIHSFYNNVNIINNGIIKVTNGSGISLFTTEDGTNYKNVINRGVIVSENEDGINILAGYNDFSGIVINEGYITASRYGISNMGNYGLILNEGTINSVSDGIYVMVNEGNITNTGMITSENYAINSGEYGGTGTFTNSGTLNGNLKIASTGLTTNSGTINLKGAVTSSIAGDYTQTSSATLSIDADITDANSVAYSKLSVARTATLDDGTNIRVDLSGASMASYFELNSGLADVISAGTLTVDVSKLNIIDNSALLSFIATKDGNTLDLNVTQALTIEDVVSQETPQSGGAARTLDKIPSGTDDDIDIFKNHLYTLSTNDEVSQAVTSTTPTGTVVTSTVGGQLINTMSHVIEARQASVRGFSSGDMVFSDKNVWVKPYGGHTKQDNVDGITGFSADSFGLGVGVDGEYKAGYRVGLAFFYTNANVDTNDIEQSSDLDVFNIMAYGSNPIIDDKTNLFYQVGYGYQQTDTSRSIIGLDKTATADYNARSYYLQLKATRDIEINKSFHIRPAIMTSYTYYKNPSYTESGAGGMSLHVDGFSSDSFIMGIESDFDYKIDKDTKLISNLALNYDFNNKAQTVNSSFIGGGATFSTRGIENDSLIYKAGVGVATKLSRATYLDFKYDLDGRGSDFLNHVVSAKFNYKF